ncbi:hypothetical protein [Streptomyces sp. PT12]|uniref:hypothetical protein n=1 Tax=Streptomyces sp. PT12 TaxID=1510197 RepID=UPI0015EF2655|nr:hypothetical protein [Streptomyces sp. PT12]
MTAVSVTILPAPPKTRPELPETLVATPTLVVVSDVDDLMSGIACSCSGSDDNPH